MKKQNINLMDSYLLIEKRKSAKTDRLAVFAAIFLGVILILGAFTFKLILDNNSLGSSIKATQTYVNDPAIKARIALVEQSQQKIKAISDINVILDQLNASFGVFPRINTLLLRKLEVNLPAGATFRSISFDGQWFTIYVACPDYTKPSEYAVRLQNTKIFEEVIYNGYTSEDSAGAKVYIGKITVILKVGK